MSRRSTQWRRLGLVGGVAGLAILASGCAHAAPQDSLRPAGTESRFIDNLFVPVFWIAVVIFFLVAGLVIVFCIKYRARGEDDRPRQVHGSTKIEIAWTIVPALLLIGVGAASVTGVFHLYRVPKGAPITVQATGATSGTISGDVLHVNVIAHRWWFEFRYPGMGPNGNDLVTANELFIPARRQVYLDITSNEPLASPENVNALNAGHGIGDGVIHNFWIPRLAGKIYAIPGHITHPPRFSTPTATRHLSGQCSEFCGISHANMRIRVVAQTPTDFAAWVANQQQLAKRRTQQPTSSRSQHAYAGYHAVQRGGTCTGCHTVQGMSGRRPGGPQPDPPAGPHLLRRLTSSPQRRQPAGLAAQPAGGQAWRQHDHPPKLTEAQITSLIAYLDTLK